MTKFRPKESVIRLPIMGAPEPDAHLRQILRAGLHHHIPRLDKPLGGGLEIRIGLDGLLHQCVQHRIAIQFPPIGAQGVIRRGCFHEGTRPMPRRRHDVLGRLIGRRQIGPRQPFATRRQRQHQHHQPAWPSPNALSGRHSHCHCKQLLLSLVTFGMLGCHNGFVD